MTATIFAENDERAGEMLADMGCTDGLPIVIPTRDRVDQMMAVTGLQTPDLLLGTVGPIEGSATVEKVAIAAVMAGAQPHYFPVIVAAVRAVCQARFHLSDVQTAISAVAPLMIVNGPVREECGLASGAGALGPGFRANATIGRALRLVLINIGGGRPGLGDPSQLGQPAKFSYCLAEAEEESPFPPLHVSLGFRASESVVTLVGALGLNTIQVIPGDQFGNSAQMIMSSLGWSLAGPATNPAIAAGNGTNATVILNPMHAQCLAYAGYDRRRIQEELVDRAANTRGTMRQCHGTRIPQGDDHDLLRAFREPEDLLVLVAGTPGYYSTLMPGQGWDAGLASSEVIAWNQSCDLPQR